MMAAAEDEARKTLERRIFALAQIVNSRMEGADWCVCLFEPEGGGPGVALSAVSDPEVLAEKLERLAAVTRRKGIERRTGRRMS